MWDFFKNLFKKASAEANRNKFEDFEKRLRVVEQEFLAFKQKIESCEERLTIKEERLNNAQLEVAEMRGAISVLMQQGPSGRGKKKN